MTKTGQSRRIPTEGKLLVATQQHRRAPPTPLFRLTVSGPLSYASDVAGAGVACMRMELAQLTFDQSDGVEGTGCKQADTRRPVVAGYFKARHNVRSVGTTTIEPLPRAPSLGISCLRFCLRSVGLATWPT
eukprot:scaffold7387_cov408-Prasinococcus_capsulatus_cf.AAC.15